MTAILEGVDAARIVLTNFQAFILIQGEGIQFYQSKGVED